MYQGLQGWSCSAFLFSWLYYDGCFVTLGPLLASQLLHFYGIGELGFRVSMSPFSISSSPL